MRSTAWWIINSPTKGKVVPLSLRFFSSRTKASDVCSALVRCRISTVLPRPLPVSIPPADRRISTPSAVLMNHSTHSFVPVGRVAITGAGEIVPSSLVSASASTISTSWRRQAERRRAGGGTRSVRNKVGAELAGRRVEARRDEFLLVRRHEWVADKDRSRLLLRDVVLRQAAPVSGGVGDGSAMGDNNCFMPSVVAETSQRGQSLRNVEVICTSLLEVRAESGRDDKLVGCALGVAEPLESLLPVRGWDRRLVHRVKQDASSNRGDANCTGRQGDSGVLRLRVVLYATFVHGGHLQRGVVGARPVLNQRDGRNARLSPSWSLGLSPDDLLDGGDGKERVE
jgi:hypothetical protein